MPQRLSVVPAYGRDYKSKKEVQEAFDANKDFTINDLFGGNDGRAVNKQDLQPGDVLNVRYKKLTQVAVITKR